MPSTTANSSTRHNNCGGCCYSVEAIPGRGRGVVATGAISKGSVAMAAAAPDVSVLYSPFGRVVCSRCFSSDVATPQGERNSNESKSSSSSTRDNSHCSSSSGGGGGSGYACRGCDQFVLCGACVAAMTTEVRHTNGCNSNSNDNHGSNGSSDGGDGGTSTVAAAIVDEPLSLSLPLLRRHPLLRLHCLSCAWYNELPASVRAVGLDTDMLRFCLEYGARIYHERRGGAAAHEEHTVSGGGGGSVPSTTTTTAADEKEGVTAADEAALAAAVCGFESRVWALDAAADAQDADAVQFWDSFAKDKIVRTFGPNNGNHEGSSAIPRYPVDGDHLSQVLLRTQVNSLGFPYSADDTLGWSLQHTVCMLNHSCEPNTAVGHCTPTNSTDNDDNAGSDAVSVAFVAGASGPSIGVVALRDIAAGEELTMSYVNLATHGDDVKGRTRALLERYRFLCSCRLCLVQRAQARR